MRQGRGRCWSPGTEAVAMRDDAGKTPWRRTTWIRGVGANRNPNRFTITGLSLDSPEVDGAGRGA